MEITYNKEVTEKYKNDFDLWILLGKLIDDRKPITLKINNVDWQWDLNYFIKLDFDESTKQGKAKVYAELKNIHLWHENDTIWIIKILKNEGIIS